MNLSSGKNLDAIRALRARELLKYDATYFSTEYWKEDFPGAFGNGGRSYNDPNHRDRFDIIARALRGSLAFESLLDVGCGPGLLLRALAPGDGELAGIDASEAALDLARQVQLDTGSLADRADLVLAPCTRLPFANKSFEVVVCLDVLEHLIFFDIQLAISEMLRTCKKHLILSINSDNPYLYHPTILSSDTWRAIFASCEELTIDTELEESLQSGVGSRRDEYTFYAYVVD